MTGMKFGAVFTPTRGVGSGGSSDTGGGAPVAPTLTAAAPSRTVVSIAAG